MADKKTPIASDIDYYADLISDKNSKSTIDLHFPNYMFNPRLSHSFDNLLWIRFKFMKVKGLFADVTKTGGLDVDDSQKINLYFLAPNDMQENIEHKWEDSTGIVSRAMEFTNKLSSAAQEIKAVGGSLTDDIKQLGAYNNQDITDASKKSASSNVSGNDISLADASINAARNLARQGIYAYNLKNFYKYDAPVAYKNSTRPVLSWTFNLADGGGATEPGDGEKDGGLYDVMLPIQLIKYLSSPSKVPMNDPDDHADSEEFRFPYICSIDTMLGNNIVPIVNVKYAAITGVQPSYKAPYRNGMPTTGTLQITVESIEPIYRETQAGVGPEASSGLITIVNKQQGKRTKIVNSVGNPHISMDVGKPLVGKYMTTSGTESPASIPPVVVNRSTVSMEGLKTSGRRQLQLDETGKWMPINGITIKQIEDSYGKVYDFAIGNQTYLGDLNGMTKKEVDIHEKLTGKQGFTAGIRSPPDQVKPKDKIPGKKSGRRLLF